MASTPHGFELRRARAEFPVLARQAGGQPLVYLDSAATTQTPRPVLAAMNEYYERFRANVHRGDYSLAVEATAAYEAARDRVAAFLGAPEREGVVFTRGCTEAINLVAHAWARRHLRPGDEILLSVLEHHSNLVPWQLAARATGARLRFLQLDGEGRLRLEQLPALVTPTTRLIAVSAMSNVLGSVTDLQPIADAARGVGALLLVDAAQLAAHAPLDAGALGADFVALSGHKLLGPTGIGALVARRELLEEMDPFLAGGEMIRDVTLEDATWADPPYKFEAGTPPVAEAIGLGAAIRHLEEVGWEAIRAQETRLVTRGLAVLRSVPGLRLHGPSTPERRGATFAFNLFDRRGELIHPHDVGTLLGAEGIAIRAGHHCAKPLMRELGVPATCRASCCYYNSEEELAALGEALERARAFFDRS